MLISLNGEFIQKNEAAIPALQSGVYYGTGCFETIRAESGRLLFFDEHYNRLKSGLLYLGVNEPGIPEYQILIKNSEMLLKENGLNESTANVRIQCTLAEKNGYAFDDDAELHTIITAEKYHQKNKPIILTIAKTRVVPDNCRPADLKLCNMLHYRNAYREAQKKNVHDAVMLSVNGFVSETSIANIFWKSGDIFYTPSSSCDLLLGITRKYMLQSIETLPEYKLVEGKYVVEDIMKADSVWVTNSLKEIQPVERIDDQKFRIDTKLRRALQEAYQAFKENGYEKP